MAPRSVAPDKATYKPLPPTPTSPPPPRIRPRLPRYPFKPLLDGSSTFDVDHMSALQAREQALASAQQYLNNHVSNLMQERANTLGDYQNEAQRTCNEVSVDDDILRLVEQEQGFALQRAFLKLEIENTLFVAWRCGKNIDTRKDSTDTKIFSSNSPDLVHQGSGPPANRTLNQGATTLESKRRSGFFVYPLSALFEESEDGKYAELRPSPLSTSKFSSSDTIDVSQKPSAHLQGDEQALNQKQESILAERVGISQYEADTTISEKEREMSNSRPSVGNRASPAQSNVLALSNLIARRSPTPPLSSHPAFSNRANDRQDEVKNRPKLENEEKAGTCANSSLATSSEMKNGPELHEQPHSSNGQTAKSLGIDEQQSAARLRKVGSLSKKMHSLDLMRGKWPSATWLNNVDTSKIPVHEATRLGERAASMFGRLREELGRMRSPSPGLKRSETDGLMTPRLTQRSGGGRIPRSSTR